MRSLPSEYQQATFEETPSGWMSKATIYLYYKNKDDLFLHVVEKLVEMAIAETTQAAEAPGAPLDKLARLVCDKMAFYEHEREFFRIYLNEKHGLDLNEKHGLEVAPKDPHKRLLRHMYLQGVDMLARVLQEGIDAGVLRPMETRRLAFFLQEMMSVGAAPGKAKTPWRRMPSNCSTCFHGAHARRGG
jgi:AcrR family transcriptional regulator